VVEPQHSMEGTAPIGHGRARERRGGNSVRAVVETEPRVEVRAEYQRTFVVQRGDESARLAAAALGSDCATLRRSWPDEVDDVSLLRRLT
jgi:hypothetical protein